MKANIPIGIILVTIGAASAPAWVARDVIESDPVLYKCYLKPFDDSHLSKEKPDDSFTWEKVTRPTLLYNAMIHPLFKLKIKGIIWYNGELNRGVRSLYTKLIMAMIKDRRNKFNIAQLPFYAVQQASYLWENNDNESYNYAIFRESQADFRVLPYTEMAILIDEPDRTKLHPRNKKLAALRLACIALNKDYGFEDIQYKGPQVEKVDFKKEHIVIEYKKDTIGNGLQTSDNQMPNSFFIASDNRIFRPANAKIKGHKIFLTYSEDQNPVAVRYAFTNGAITNLTNSSGLPAEPYRTDRWENLKIITIANVKGESGKTTLALNIAAYFKKQYNVAIVDTSLRGSLSELKKRHVSIDIINENDPKSIRKLPYDLLIIDTPPNTVGLEQILQLSDFKLIPTKANTIDALSLAEMQELVSNVQHRFAAKSGVVVNNVKKITGDSVGVYNYLKGLPIRLMDSIVHERLSFVRSVFTGGLSEMNDAKALMEIEQLCDEIMCIFNY